MRLQHARYIRNELDAIMGKAGVAPPEETAGRLLGVAVSILILDVGCSLEDAKATFEASCNAALTARRALEDEDGNS